MIWCRPPRLSLAFTIHCKYFEYFNIFFGTCPDSSSSSLFCNFNLCLSLFLLLISTLPSVLIHFLLNYTRIYTYEVNNTCFNIFYLSKLSQQSTKGGVIGALALALTVKLLYSTDYGIFQVLCRLKINLIQIKFCPGNY